MLSHIIALLSHCSFPLPHILYTISSYPRDRPWAPTSYPIFNSVSTLNSSWARVETELKDRNVVLWVLSHVGPRRWKGSEVTRIMYFLISNFFISYKIKNS